MGRKPGLTRSEKRLREEIARVLPMVIGNGRGAQTKAADLLKISRQALSLYLLKKATPGAEILRRICEAWNLTLDVDGALITRSDAPRNPSSPKQLSLFTAISEVSDRNVEVAVIERSSKSLDLKVSITFDK
jgi:transcriptional regulator with XRE-family HTH domain